MADTPPPPHPRVTASCVGVETEGVMCENEKAEVGIIIAVKVIFTVMKLKSGNCFLDAVKNRNPPTKVDTAKARLDRIQSRFRYKST